MASCRGARAALIGAALLFAIMERITPARALYLPTMFNSKSGETRPTPSSQAERRARARSAGPDWNCSAMHFGEGCAFTVPDLPRCIGGGGQTGQSYTDWWTLHADVLVTTPNGTYVSVMDVPSLHMGARQVCRGQGRNTKGLTLKPHPLNPGP